MEQLVDYIQQNPMVQTLVASPGFAVAVLILAFLLGKVMKLTGKVLKAILLVCVAYVILSAIMARMV